ncbi:MAG: hypothetical protein OXL97_07040 [Chloroflexota bacterium]|nr:hypothetical protein [Chloroflexota bacterium]MDE2885995.1 hypothetical protein [Chloroflexota bacterium]
MIWERHESPSPDPFVQEHVGAIENRVNLGMLALLNVTEFRFWFLERLGLPLSSVVYPPQNWKGVRPDFVVVLPSGDVAGWIEVELGPPDHAQLETYRGRLVERVVCIAGTDAGDLTLSEIAVKVRRIQAVLSDQQAISARMLLELIEASANRPEPQSYTTPDDNLRREPLIASLAERLSDRLIFGVPPVPRGKILLTTITQKGWSMRLYSPVSQAGRSLGVMWNQAAGGGELRVPSQARLHQYLPNNSGTQMFVDFIARTAGVDVSPLPDSGHAPIPEQQVLEHIDELADILSTMALYA